MTKTTGKVKGLHDIMDSDKIKKIDKHGIDFEDDTHWSFNMNEFIGETIELETVKTNYDFQAKGYIWRYKKEWLEDVKEEIDFSKLEKDTPVLVWNNEGDVPSKRYFAKYEDGEKYCYGNGKTSWSNNEVNDMFRWNHLRLPKEEELKEVE